MTYLYVRFLVKRVGQGGCNIILRTVMFKRTITITVT